MNGAQSLVNSLEQLGVDLVFGYPGGAIMPVYDALYGSSIRHILVRNEQAAALAADAYARVTGKPGVCLATSGPGATNLVTGIANARLDSVPLLVITGQVSSEVLGTDAFQEVDIFGMTLPVVKHSYLVTEADDLSETVTEAYHLAATGRPGPVLIDVTKDAQLAPVGPMSQDPIPVPALVPAPVPSSDSLSQARALLTCARRPVVYAGGGIALGQAVEPFRAFVEHFGAPVVATLKGLGAVPTRHPLFLGMLGMHGLKAANLAVQECDLLVCVGARFDDRATGKLATFAPNAKVVHLDIDPAEVGKLRRPAVSLVGSLHESLPALHVTSPAHDWTTSCQQSARESAYEYPAESERVHGPTFLRLLSEALPEQSVVTCDVGQHQMWVAQHWHVDHPTEHLSSGGLGTMGYGLPAALGAQLARPDALVVNIAGDGSFMMNVQELATIARYRLPVKIVILDNSALGLVRQWQELFFDRRYSEVDLSDNPDFVQVARSFGIPALTLDNGYVADRAIDHLVHSDGPLLLHVKIPTEEMVWPLVAPGKSNAQMMEGVVS